MMPSQKTLSFAGCQWTWRSFQQECSGGGCWNLTEICRRFQAIKKEMEAPSHVHDVGKASGHTRNCTEFLPRIMEAIGQPNSWWSEAQKWKTVSSAWSMNWRGHFCGIVGEKGVLCVLGGTHPRTTWNTSRHLLRMPYASHVSLLILSLCFRCMISNHYDYDPNAVKAECKHDMHTHIPIITYKMYNLLFLVCPDNLYIFSACYSYSEDSPRWRVHKWV